MKKTVLSEWSGILVYLECNKGHIHKASMEMLGAALRLMVTGEEKLAVLGIGEEMEQIEKELAGYPVDIAYFYETEDEYCPELYEKIAVSCIQKFKPSIVLLGGTYEGRTLAPRLAVSFETGLTADCTILERGEGGELIQTRPAFGGNVMASIVTPESRPQFATVRPGVMEAPKKNGQWNAEIYRENVTQKDPHVEILNTVLSQVEEDITKQDVLVVAGRGVKKKEDLLMLEELAKLLGGKLASSRALVEKGYTSPEQQIGLSGHSVTPSLMITLGVSGTVQFMAGMKHTKNVIAINTDPNARIFGIAHYPICADLYEVVPELIHRLKDLKKGGSSPET